MEVYVSNNKIKLHKAKMLERQLLGKVQCNSLLLNQQIKNIEIC